MSRFQNLDVQEFQVYLYKVERLSQWQRVYRTGKGVWVPVICVQARSPWEACAKARRKHHMWRGKLKAMPTWRR